jgi:hypothetical protein
MWRGPGPSEQSYARLSPPSSGEPHLCHKTPFAGSRNPSSGSWALAPVILGARGRLAAIDDDGLAREERRLAGQKHNGIGNLLRGCRPLNRQGRQIACLPLSAAAETIEHFGLDRTWGNCIDPHAGPGAFQGCRFGQTFHRVFAGRINSSSRRINFAGPAIGP